MPKEASVVVFSRIGIIFWSNVPPARASLIGVGKLVSGKPGYSTKAIKIIPKAPIKCPTCNGPVGIPKNGLARSPSNALTVP